MEKWVISAVLMIGMVLMTMQSEKAADAASYQYGDFAVTALSSTSISVDYRNLYYDTVNGGASVLGYTIYIQDVTAGTEEQLVATAQPNQVYGPISSLTPGHQYIVSVRLQYQYPSASAATMLYTVTVTTPSTGSSTLVDTIVDTPATASPTPSSTVTASPSPSPSGAVTQLMAPTITQVKMSGENVGIVCSNVGASGYEYSIYNKSNKLIKSDSSYLNSIVIYGLSRNQVYYARVRAYGYASDGTTVYSEWSGKKYFVPQPKINSNTSKLKKTSIRLKWGKVSGAKNYTIYMRKRSTKNGIR